MDVINWNLKTDLCKCLGQITACDAAFIDDIQWQNFPT